MRLNEEVASVEECPDGGVIAHGHDGGIDGFISSYRYMPEQNWGYVILLNSSFSGRALQDLNRLAIDFLSKDFSKVQQPVVPIPASELRRFAGYYAPRAPRNQIFAFLDDLTLGTRIRVIRGQLMRSGLFGKPEPVFPVGKNLFRSEKEPEGTTIFFTDESGGMAVVGSGLEGIPYSERSSLVATYTRLVLLTVCFALMLSSLLFAPVWIARKLFGAMKDVRHLWVRGAPLLASVSLLIVPLCFMKLSGSVSGSQIGTFDLLTAGVFLGTLLFPCFSILGLVLVLRVPKSEIQRGVRIHSLLASSACCVLTGFFLSWHLLPLRLWAVA
jgi:hypothetical protein